MAKEKNSTPTTTESSWFAEMFHTGLYKRSQGKVARQATFAALAITIALAAYQLFVYMDVNTRAGGIEMLLSIWPLSQLSDAAADSVLYVVEILSPAYSIPLILFAAGAWVSYRIVNIPKFADFLIAVEAEMNKVSWPSKDELIRSSIVVIFVIVLMSGLLYGYDAFWTLIFGKHVLGILQS